MTIFRKMLFCLLAIQALHAQDKFPVLKDSVFGQEAPEAQAEVYLDGIISTFDGAEMCAGLTRDGKAFFFNKEINDRWAITVTRKLDGGWTQPVPISFTGNYTDRDFTLSPDGNKIYFGSDRPVEKHGVRLRRLDIYVSEKASEHRWSEPQNLGPSINTEAGENYPSVASNGNLYFFSDRPGSLGGCDIYVSRYDRGRFLPAENLGCAINSQKNDWDAVIAPDESFIIFSSQNRDDSIGGQDLYISFRTEGGNWTKSKNMGGRVNSEFAEICPSLSLDGKVLFFTSRRRGKADIFWIDANIIEELKSKVLE